MTTYNVFDIPSDVVLYDAFNITDLPQDSVDPVTSKEALDRAIAYARVGDKALVALVETGAAPWGTQGSIGLAQAWAGIAVALQQIEGSRA